MFRREPSCAVPPQSCWGGRWALEWVGWSWFPQKGQNLHWGEVRQPLLHLGCGVAVTGEARGGQARGAPACRALGLGPGPRLW